MAFAASDFGTSIRDFRKKNKLTHAKFGELMGMLPKISARWEKGRSVPTRESYMKLKRLFSEYSVEKVD